MQKIGNFYGNSNGFLLAENFYVPQGFGESYLGVSIDVSKELTLKPITLASNISQLRFLIQLFDEGKQEFYNADIRLGEKMSYYNLWSPDFGVLVFRADGSPDAPDGST